MANTYFDWPNKAPNQRFVAFDTVRSVDANAALDLVSAGFEKLPTPQALNGGSANFALDTGTLANIYLTSIAPAVITTYFAGLTVAFKAANSNSGASTLNLNSMGAKAILLPDGTPLAAGNIIASQIVVVTYDGTQFQMLAATTAATFDKRYLGAKAADPSTDNQGQPLTAGAMYLNTTSSTMKFYSSGGAWIALSGATAGSIAFTPAGALASTDVQAALAELDADKLGTATNVLTTAGTASAMTLTPSPAIPSYAGAVGRSWEVSFSAATAGIPTTMNINGKGSTVNLVKRAPDGSLVNVAPNDVPNGHRSICTLVSTTQLLVRELPVMPSSGQFLTKLLNADYTLTPADANVLFEHTDATIRTLTIPTNAAQALPPGFVCSVVTAPGAANTQIQTADTLVQTGTNTTGNRTLAAGGMATIVKSVSTPTRNYIAGDAT